MFGIFLDTETNGLNPYINKIFEIAFKIIDLYTGDIIDEYQSLIKIDKSIFESSNLKSLEITGFTFEELQKGKDISIIQNELITIFKKYTLTDENSFFICQNPSFDRIFVSQIIPPELQTEFNWPYHWLDLASMFWSISIKTKESNKPFLWQNNLSKDIIATTYNLPKEKLPHRAMNGVNHLILCYKSVVGFPFEETK
ncbi:MAG: DNA polymerase III PolC-type [Candidatus Anoxychlamydiales bacterium]|nr:DNA polymerase III PolC-type [Candidatus Anoxychlamydiales bacterium]